MLTPFELAIVRGNFDTAALFLRLGCLKKRGQAPSKATKEEGGEEEEGQYKGLDVGGKKMDWAKDHHAKNEEDHERYAIHVAASFNQWKAIDFLLFSAEKEWSVGKSSDEEVKHFRLDTVEKKSGNTVYHYAISRNNNEVLKKLLSADKQSVFNQPEINGVTPLHLAALYGNVEAVKLLIENRADIEAKVKKNGWTPLFYAVYANQSECVSTLLSAKAQIDTALTPNYKQTPLMLAAFYGRHESIQLMLETKCDIYIQDTCGETALHHAVKRGHYSAVKLLLNKKVPQYMEENGLGLTPLDGAMLKLIGEFPSHRSSRGDNDITLSHHQQLIYNHLIRIESKDRILAKPDQVVKVTFMMMDNAKAEVEAEKAAKLKQKHTHYFERREKEIKSPDDMHIISMTMPRAEFSNIQLPDLPPINTDGDVNMDDEDEKSEEELPTSLKGMTFAISGTFSKKRNTLISLIKKNGGNYASTITKAVTHVLVADLDDKSAKITQAKADGKKIVGESFLENLDENDSESEVSE